MSGKGSKPRPFSVSQDEFNKRWDEIFSKNKENKDNADILLGEVSAFQADEAGSNPTIRSNKQE